ncbi:MAG TPA: two-component regulator propeller domain-containing protein [Fibrobacteraceae bacterium]|nr:two-component regulator propeller domain-containing protein [Fibrobacteraceae bacterium]
MNVISFTLLLALGVQAQEFQQFSFRENANTINDLALTNDTLWIATDHGLRWMSLANQSTGWMTTLNGLLLNPVRQIEVVNNRKWVLASDIDDIYRSSVGYQENGVWTHYSLPDSIIYGKKITAMAQDSGGNLWIGGWGGISQFDGEKWNRLDFSLGDVNVMHFDWNNNLWVGTTNQLVRYSMLEEPEEKVYMTQNLDENFTFDTVLVFWHDSTVFTWDSLSLGTPQVFAQQNSNTIYIGYNAGLAVFSDSTGSLTQVALPEAQCIYDLQFDDSGDLWVFGASQLLRRSADEGSWSEVSFDSTYGIGASAGVFQGDSLWIGRYGLLLRDALGDIKYFPKMPEYNFDLAYNTFAEDGSGGICIADYCFDGDSLVQDSIVYTHSLWTSDGSRWLIQGSSLIRVNQGVQMTVKTGITSCDGLMEGYGGDVWLKDVNDLYRYHNAVWTSPDSSDGYVNLSTTLMDKSRDGSIWLGGTSALCRLDTLGNYSCNSRFAGANALFQDSLGVLWFFSGDSVFQYHDETWNAGTVADLLGVDVLIEGGSAAPDSSIWLLSAFNGVFHVSTSGEVTQYTSRDGLASNGYGMQIHVSQCGDVWVMDAIALTLINFSGACTSESSIKAHQSTLRQFPPIHFFDLLGRASHR